MASLRAISRNTYGSAASSPSSNRIGKPRRDPYNRLISRFYEPLILLEVLGSVRGDHTLKRSITSPKEIRRQFRDDLAFLCEYEKGGNACTAIGIEDTPEQFIYWAASNVEASEKIIPFLTSILHELRAVVRSPSGESQRMVSEQKLTRRCIEFATAKLKKQKGLLSKFASICIRLNDSHSEYLGLVNWLQQFIETKENTALCKLAYESRKSPHMKQLDDLIRISIDHNEPGDTRSPFAQVRHYIGRLADHIRVPKRLIQNIDDFEDLLVNEFDVRPIPKLESVPRPQADDQTTLAAICKRMLPPNDLTLEETTNILADLDRNFGIHKRVLHQYEDDNFQPRVHAEVQVLEHFYKRKLAWADTDRYVGCTKPACYCCQLYFRHHPARPVQPESHLRIWLNWGPPLLKGGSGDEMYVHQRDILNHMVAEIRREALDQIQNRRNPHPWHPDSRTGITGSTSGAAPGEAVERLVRGLQDVDLDATDTLSLVASNDTEDSRSGSSTSTLAAPTPEPGNRKDTAISVVLDDDVDTDTEGGALL